jgi:hypothetical protein
LSTVRDGLAVLVVPSDDSSLTGRQIWAAMNRRLGSPVTVDLGFAGLLLSDSASAAHLVTRTLGPVIRYDDERSSALLETLETYFSPGQSLATSARRLHVKQSPQAGRR